jgi:NADH:ubiquinone oxidoreductase subunit 3 (subunit A)
MRAAYLLSVMFIVDGIAALFGYPIYVAYRPVTGLSGFLAALAMAAVPPLVVLGFRRLRRK